jgi:hypothetical protein
MWGGKRAREGQLHGCETTAEALGSHRRITVRKAEYGQRLVKAALPERSTLGSTTLLSDQTCLLFRIGEQEKFRGRVEPKVESDKRLVIGACMSRTSQPIGD